MTINASTSCSYRRIFPISATASLTTTPANSSIFDPERATAKLEMRIADYFLTSLREIVLNTSLSRGKTLHQGAKAPRGSQAAHHSLIPNPQDPVFAQNLQRVHEAHFTPTKSLPYFKARTGLGSPELKQLKENTSNQDTLKTQLLEKMPEGSETSSIAGTRAYLFSNTTIDNPIESNTLDSNLERTIAPLLSKLQQQRTEGRIDALKSTQHLIQWMQTFYEQTLTSCAKREKKLNKCLKILQLHPLHVNTITTLLEHTLPSLPNIRLPKKMQEKTSHEQLTKFVQAKLTSLDYYRQEAALFLDHLKLYNSPCTLLDLQLGMFGILEDGQRRQPTEGELRAAVYDTLRPDPGYPYSRKRKRGLF